ncbi:phosphatase 2C-like domain-containing protein [Coniochaeta sp. 2T2.1]|nr:phosphatase 2C-like domain-containing protein [Coniochaeta sp. 2T2.1]
MRKVPPELASIVIQACRAEALVRRFPATSPLRSCYPYSTPPRPRLPRYPTTTTSRHFSLYPSIFSKTKNDANDSETNNPGPSLTPPPEGSKSPQPQKRPPRSPPSGPYIPPNLPFKFETGLALFAKRTPRPFPPPFLSRPSGSFSDALSTYDRPHLASGEPIVGRTNGDDAVFASDYFICANDGVGAWSTRPRGHAGLWARLILHFWADEVEHGLSKSPDPVGTLQAAYERTQDATSDPEWLGTTTAAGAQLYYEKAEAGAKREQELPPIEGQEQKPDDGPTPNDQGLTPLLYVTNLGDSQVMVIRPSTRSIVYKTTEQWHWFDCPRQLGTNSPDTPESNAVVDAVPVHTGDVVLAMSDGVIDNLWAHEIVTIVCDSVEQWAKGEGHKWAHNGMHFVAHELVERAKKIALDPFAESPFMEHAIEEGLPSEGGKLDDISVVAALCMRNDDYESR